MRVLLMGGSVFLGRAFAEEALRRGHEVTAFNRGRSGTDVPGVAAIRGDREVDEDLDALVKGGRWDAVIDTSGQIPEVVGHAARAISGHADTYLFVSSVHAYRDWPAEPVDEESERHECPPDAGRDDVANPNALKAGCERAVERDFDGRVLIINPGLIVGPRENTGRLLWWLTRISEGGRVLAPGEPGRKLQLIDARDIAAFGLDQIEQGADGRFIASGVVGNTTFGDLLDDCVEVTGSAAELVWADDAFLLGREVAMWTELPLWAPDRAETASIWSPSSAKALDAGLRCRPVSESVKDTWDWLRTTFAETGQGIAPDKEARLLAELTSG